MLPHADHTKKSQTIKYKTYCIRCSFSCLSTSKCHPLPLQREGTFRRGIQRGEMAAKVLGRAGASDVLGVRHLGKKEQRDESSFYCDVLCRENPPNVAQVRKVFGIFHCILVYFCDSTLYIYRYIHGRIAEVFPLPFLIFLSMIMLAEHCQVWNSRTTAGWLVSACRKLPSSWNVVIKMVRRGSAASLVHNGPYIHTDLPKSCIDHICFEPSPVNGQLSSYRSGGT